MAGCNCTATYKSTYTYNNARQLLVATDPLGHQTSRQYDANGNVSYQIDGNGNKTTYQHDADNELTAVTYANGTTDVTDYNPDGTVLDEKDGKGNVIVAFSYDPLARVVAAHDAVHPATTYTYDVPGNLHTVVDSQSPPQTTAYGYDAAGEVTSIAYSDGKTPSVSNMKYDANSRRTAMTDGTGTSGWSYDSLGRLTAATDGGGNTVSYAYDLKGQIIRLTYPGQSTPVTRGYDDAGRLRSVTDWLGNVTTLAYDVDSNVVSQAFPSGVTDTHTVDAADRLTAISDTKGSSTLATFSYQLDSSNQVTQDTPGGSSFAKTAAQNYAYTTKEQLCLASATSGTCANPPKSSTSYGYDAAGNITQAGSNFLTYDAAGQLCFVATSAGSCGAPPNGATVYSYDSRGNRTAVAPPHGSATTYTYDQADRLVGYGTNATYAYNGDGLRMGKTVGGSGSSFVWDLGDGLPLVLKDGANSYIYAGNRAIEQITGSNVLNLHQDQVGSTRIVTDAGGNAVATYTFDAYGNVATQTGSASSPLEFAGGYKDGESGFYYLQARYYDPATAQFLSRDPMVATTRSPYGYTGGNPLNHTDPSGRDDYNTVPSQYRGPLARCWAGYDSYTIIQLSGEDGQQACDRALPGKHPVDLNGPPEWGGNGENTGGVNYPAEVNGGAYNNGAVVNPELGNAVADTILSVALTATMPFFVPPFIEVPVDIADWYHTAQAWREYASLKNRCG